MLPDPPDIVDISVNQTVNESDTVNLTCEADANPKASITWTRVSDNSSVTFPLTIIGKQDEGGYRCTAENSIQDPARKTFYIIVESESNCITYLEFFNNQDISYTKKIMEYTLSFKEAHTVYSVEVLIYLQC